MSRKRSHRAMNGRDHGDEGTDMQSASSSFGHGLHSKRARVSIGEPRKKHSQRQETPASEAPLDHDDDSAAPEGNGSPPRTQYEMMRDAGFKHLQHQDIDDQIATQKMTARSQRIGENHAADNGIIESVECINFMCHERLFVQLGPLLNFVVGENGSGKSAVLTALTLCLGGKASSTNRGGNLKSFIKEGRDHSSITVCIKNKGLDSFQADLYGETIKVERHFSKGGSSGFKLRNECGKIISTKKADIDEITEWWAMQVDNPLVVLSQDNARQFLNAATPASKYKFFFKGVQLEQLDHDYRYISETLESHEAKLPVVEEEVLRAEDAYNHAKRNKEASDRNQGLRQEGSRLRKKLLWSQVVDQERKLERYRAEVDAFDSQLAEDAQRIQETSQKLEEADAKIHQCQEIESAKRQERDAQGELVDAADEEYRKAKAELTSLHRQEREVGQQLKTADEVVKNWQRNIEIEKKRLGEGAENARRKLQEKIDAATTEEIRLQEQIETVSTEVPELAGETQAAAAKVKEHSKIRGEKQQEISGAQSRLHSLQSKSDNALEPKMVRLLKAIGQDNRFERKPVGPIGSQIQLLHPEWSSILESTFGNFLDNFLVANKRDQQHLSNLMQKLDIKGVGIVIGRSLPASIRLKEPDEQYLTILRALNIQNLWVRDQLVVNYMIEKIILVEKREDAEEIMFGTSPPPNVSVCLTRHPTIRRDGIRLVSKSSNISSSPVRAWTRPPRMMSDVETQISIQQQTLADLQQDLKAIQEEHRCFEANHRRCEEQHAQCLRTSQNLETQLRKIQAEIESLKEELDQYEGADGRLANLEEQLNQAQEEKDHHGNQYGEMQLQKETLNKTAEEKKRSLSSAKASLEEIDEKLIKLEGKLKRNQDLRQMALVGKNGAYEAQAQTSMQREQAEQQREEQAARVADFTAQASHAVPERVFVGEDETTSSIESKYEAIRKQLDERARVIGKTDEQIAQELSETKDRYKSWAGFYKAQQELHRAGKQSLQDRMRKWRNFQALISAHARTAFLLLLSERGFRGQLLFNHKDRKLHLSVEPDETRKSAAGRNTKTLSGGEKSFSSICMLLAIWEAMGAPFRCLDEFDVFMDNVNRTISTNMLINTARRAVGRQFIMITPNAIEGRAKLADDVKIIRLTDPRQRTLV